MRGIAGALGRRAIQAVLVALVVASVSFLAMSLLPGDAAFRVAAGRYGYDMVNAAAAASVRAELGLDRPLAARFLEWLFALARFDLGRSMVTGGRVADEIAHQLGHTLLLALAGLGVSAAIGPALGALAGLRPGGGLDRASLVGAVGLRALPAFVVGIGLIMLFAVGLGWLPAAGYGNAASLILPAATLGLGLAAASCRVARDAMARVRAEPFFAFARMKGLSDRQALLRHGLRHAALPVLAFMGVQLAWLVEGVVVVETLFGWPGIGHALVHAVIGRDLPMVQGTALVMGLGFVALNAVVDTLCLALDPRARAT